ncbi:MAG: precorrin-8X methylmutase [Bacteroidota bacterium]|nr:precorrin-8X methylmutase [Kiloniellaceae bacterium]
MTTTPHDYIRDPREISRRSFEIVQAETDLSALPADVGEIALRVVHACGMPEIAADLAWEGDLVTAGRGALEAGATVLADCAMVANGVTRARLPAGNAVRCTLNDPRTPELATRLGITRSAAAVDLWGEELKGAVVAIGNAPTALYRLMELLAEGAPRPAVILAFPVGFVGAAESKDALIAAGLGVPYLTLCGRRGGSAMAAAAVNALAQSGF